LGSIALKVEVTRGDAAESTHHAHGIVCSAGGGSEACLGDPGLLTYWRSAMKPFQALAVLEDGAASAFDIDAADLAVCCASHGGMSQHTQRVAAMLQRMELQEADLHCGPHPPFDRDTAHDLACVGRPPGRLHNNCSGKHAGMLALARYHGWPHEGYERLDHQVQRRIRQALTPWMDVDPEDHAWALDGCGVPTPLLPLREMARAYSRIVRCARQGHEAAAAVVEAMTRHSHLTSSPGRVPLVVMEATGGRLLAKEGAEGVLCVSAVDEDWGLAVKIEDGSLRAVGPAAVELLDSAGLLRAEEREALESLRRVPITNTLDEQVGEISTRRLPGDRAIPA
jgi:L-asparaginase II